MEPCYNDRLILYWLSQKNIELFAIDQQEDDCIKTCGMSADWTN